jgi:prophage DNA circulation protein
MHLVETARPLPRMLNYRFYLTMPNVVMAHRLYADASRADELRNENKIVHPAFCPRQGRALSA